VSVFIDSFIEYLGLTRSMISMFYSAGTLLAGMIILFVGKQVDRYGHRKIITIIAAVFGAVCLYMSFIVNPVMLFAGFFLIRLFGQRSMIIGPSTLVPRWFEKKRGRALSLVSIGGIIGAGLMPPFNIWMINNWGWRMGWRFWAIAILLVMVPLAWSLIRNSPADIGLSPDGIVRDTYPDPQSDDKEHSKSQKPALSMNLAEARRTPSFWLLHFSIFSFSMIITGITFHIVSIFKEQGLPAEVAASTLSITAILSFPVTLIAGVLLDKIKIRYVLISIYIFFSAALILLLNVNTLSKAVIFGILIGAIMGFQHVTLNMVWPDYFGLGHLGSIIGAGQISLVAGSAFGALPFGIAFDHFGGYKEIILVMAVFSALSAAASFFSFPPVKKNI
jgi:MFS family permease